MFNFNDLINLALNSMEYEGLSFDGLFQFFTSMGVSENMADDLINTINEELHLSA